MAKYFADYVDVVSKTSERTLTSDEVNIRQALELAHHHGYHQLVVKLCVGMQYFWRNGGLRDVSLRYLPLGIQAAKKIATATQQREDYLTEADLTYTHGQILFQTSRLEADQFYRDSLAIYQKIEEQEKAGIVLSALGRLSLSRGQMREAEDYCKRALEIHQTMGNAVEMGVDLSSLAQIAIDCGQVEQAERYLERAAPTRQQGRARRIDCIEWGRIALARRRLDEAEYYFNQALEISQDEKGKEMDRRGEAASFSRLGQVALGCGQLEKAKELLQIALAIHQEVQDPEGVGEALLRFAHLAELQGNLDSAEKQYQASLDTFYAAQLDRFVPNTLLEFGRFLTARRGKREEGCLMLLQAAQRYARMGIYSTEMGLPGEQKARERAWRLGCSEQESISLE